MPVKISQRDNTLLVEGVQELNASNSNGFRDQVHAAMTDSLKNVDIDLSKTAFVDSCGLGALISIHKTICLRKGVVRLLRPGPEVSQILELTRLHRIFEVLKA
jgi:anti-sigma B factor antagonist